MDSIIPQTFSFGPQLVKTNLSTTASTLLEFGGAYVQSSPSDRGNQPTGLRDRVGVWFVAPTTNTVEVSISLNECPTNATFAQNAVVDLTPGEKRMFYVKYGQNLYAYSTSASQAVVAYEVVIERVKS